MAFTAKILAAGQLANSDGQLYAPAASTKAYVKFVRLWNRGTTVEAALVDTKPNGATARRIAQAVLEPGAHCDVLDKDDAECLGASDGIRGQSTNSTSVDYTITGGEEA